MPLSANALTTLSAAQAVASGVSSARLEMAINAISAAVEAEFGPIGYKAVVTESLPGSGEFVLRLKRAPIRSVASVAIDGVLVTDFELDTERGELHRHLGWPRVVYSHCDLTRDLDPALAKANIVATYTAGWILPQYGGVVNATHNPSGLTSDLPADIEFAVVSAVAEVASRPTANLAKETTPGGWSREWSGGTSGGRQGLLPSSLLAALSRLRRNWTH